jgi:shikimate kinase
MNIVLIGYRCSGKTTVGRRLADRLKRVFVDTDTLIEQRKGSPVEDIVAARGWKGFRDMEREMISEVARRDGQVIATGGGVVMDGANVRNLRANGCMVWLRADTAVLRERMARDRRSGRTRPPLAGTDSLAETEEIMKMRAPLYKKASDLVIDTNAVDARQAADLVLDRLQEIHTHGGA